MLVLSRKTDQSLLINGSIRVTVLAIRGNQVRLGIEAPPDVRIVRDELVGIPSTQVAWKQTGSQNRLFSASCNLDHGGPLSFAVNSRARGRSSTRDTHPSHPVP
ncbi:MAG: hypothetical protein KatS3mg108_2836 [Isosphaeraceae bacterium]|jgi:carbon storage regulator|nr:MAG: hypothetical protein KatS3mg108_2836 [Isosphaeraceae bacterium]